MRPFIYLLTALLILISCGTNTFSKRKHLPGQFWNKVEKYRSQKSAKKENSNQHTVVFTENSVNSSDPEESLANSIETQSSSEQQNEPSAIPASDEKEIFKDQPDKEVTTDTPTSLRTESSASEERKSTSARSPRNGFFWLAVWIIVMISLLAIGLILILLWLILRANNPIGNWMLITGIIMAGIPLLLGLIVIIFA